MSAGEGDFPLLKHGVVPSWVEPQSVRCNGGPVRRGLVRRDLVRRDLPSGAFAGPVMVSPEGVLCCKIRAEKKLPVSRLLSFLELSRIRSLAA
jgi:hypothetical protein